MADLPWLTALYPQKYTSSWSLPGKAIRLFGDGWAFCIVPEPILTSPYGGADIVFKAARFATPHRRSTNWQWQRRNLFALDYGQERFEPHYNEQPGEHFYKYNPVNDGTAAGAFSTSLIARFLPNVQGRPLYQLLQGRIEVPQESSTDAQTGRQSLLTALRRECGIKATTGTPQRAIFLYPDGICLFGRIAVPGQPTELEGWFKISTRAMAVPAAAMSEVGRGLSLCLDETLPGNAGPNGHIARWQSAFETMRSAFSDTAFAGTKWLSVEGLEASGLEALFWPGDHRSGQPDYFRRNRDSALHIAGSIARLRLCPDGLTVGPNLLQVGGNANELSFQSVADANSHARNCPSLHYSYVRTHPSEVIAVAGNRSVRTKPCGDDNLRAVKLNIPLIETAQKLRRESGMPEGGEAGLDVLLPVWTFTQLDNGLIHWPFPDATAEALSALLETAPEVPAAGVPIKRPDDPAGAILLGNRPDREGFRADLRPWSVAVTECRDLALALKLIKVGGCFVLDEANIWIGEHEMVLEGALQAIPFRQTSERLLPDHDERAMRTTSLRAVSPGLLQGLEQAAQRRLSEEVGAVLEIEDLRLFPTTKTKTTKRPTTEISSGRVSAHVTLPCRYPNTILPGADEVAAIRPWIWTWHDKLPTVQAHGLAEAGAALSQPSGLRQLAPLRRRTGRRDLTYVFENALDPTCLAPRLRLDQQYGEGGIYAAPEINPHYACEVGMAVLTLPSVTLFPGHRDLGEAAMPDRLPELASTQPQQWTWPIGNQTIPFLVEMRQDLVLRDEFYAQAAVGADKADADTLATASQQDRFEPLDTNGPQAWSVTAGERHSWKRLWAYRDRQAALAATAPRALITRSNQQRLLANLLPQGPQVVDLTLRLERIGDNIGSVEIRDTVGAAIAIMHGLPAVGDLEGVTSVVYGVALEYGTARIGLRTAGGWSFTDQRGLTTTGVTSNGMIVSRVIGTITLVSCTAPFKAMTPASIAAIQFWFADVPSLMDDAVATLARSDFAHNHMQGYRWAISQGGSPKAHICLGGCLSFVPLVLTGATGTAIAASLKVSGFLEVRSQGGAVPQRADDAIVSLLLATNAMPILDVGPDIVLRLTDPGVTGTAPVVLKIIPPDKAMLYVELLGRNFEFLLKQVDPLATVPSHLAAVLPLEFEMDAAPSTARLALTSIKISLSNPKGPQVVLTYAFAFEASGGKFTGEFAVDAIEGTVQATKASFELKGLSVSPPVVLRLTPDCLLVSWRDLNPEPLSVTEGLFEGARVTAYSGHLAAVLDQNLGVSTFEFEFEVHLDISLNGKSVVLVLTGDTASELRLSGDATVAAAHDIELSWRSETLKSLAGASVAVATHVVHHLNDREPRRLLVLAQYVVLARSATGLIVQCDTVAVCNFGRSKSWLVQLRGANLTGAELAPLTAGQRTRALVRLSQALAKVGWATDFLPSFGAPITRDLCLPPLAPDWIPGEAYGLSPAVIDILASALNYSDVLTMFAKVHAGALMPAPRTPPQAPTHAGYRLSATDSNGAHFVEIGHFAPDIAPKSIDDSSLHQWALGILADRAPWASGALLQIRRRDDLLPRNLVVTRDMRTTDDGRLQKLSVRSRPQPSPFTARSDTPVVTDPRRVAMPSGAAKLLGGFRPVHAAALTFTYGKSETGEDLLSVRAMERAWRLDHAGDLRASAHGDEAEYWLQDRSDTSFRNVANTRGGRLSAESPAEVPEMAGSGVLYPVTGDAAEQVTPRLWQTQFVIPAYSVTRDFAPRPGVAQSGRLGLSGRSVIAGIDPNTKNAAYAPEVPFHAITPRPPLIGVNDRLRCDEFTTGVAAEVSLRPKFLLFGPCAERPHRVAGRAGLERKPLARDKVLVTLTYPDKGAIDGSWDGRLDFAVPAAPPFSIEPIWVSVDIDGRHFHGDLAPGNGLGPIDCFDVKDVDPPPKMPGDDGPPKAQTLRKLFQRLALSTRARFEIGFLVTAPESDGTERRIGRIAVLDLPVSPRSASRLEHPHHFRFEDPEYNDLIERRFAVKKRNGMTIVVDRDKVRAEGTVILVAGQDVPEDWSPSLTLAKPGKDGCVEKSILLAPPSRFGDKCWLIDCRRFVARMGQGEQGKRPKPEVRDRLEVSLGAGDPITIEITEEEPFAKNPASLVVLQALAAADRAPLFAPMSQPAMVELVDPFDLLYGVARYRSSYGWRLFAPSTDVAYRLQKIGGSGAMHLSQILDIYVER